MAGDSPASLPNCDNKITFINTELLSETSFKNVTSLHVQLREHTRLG